jgi:hypothetical protein
VLTVRVAGSQFVALPGSEHTGIGHEGWQPVVASAQRKSINGSISNQMNRVLPRAAVHWQARTRVPLKHIPQGQKTADVAKREIGPVGNPIFLHNAASV